VLGRLGAELGARHAAGRPFLAVALTVSLHSPWEFPAGRAPDLEEWIVVRHPYDVPEVLRTLVKAAGPGYQSWVRAEVH